MDIAALVSGGKDSLYAIYLERENRIKYIISVISRNKESYMFHVPNAHLVKHHAELMNIPLIQKKIKGEKEKELLELKEILKDIEVDGIVTGAVASNYQKQRIDNICNELNIKSIAPLWQKDPYETIKNMIKDGFEIMIVAVAAPPLDEKWLGRIIDDDCIEELKELNEKHGIHILGEGGEYDTFVLDCPMFKKKIIVKDSEKFWDEKTRSGILKINRIDFEDK